MTTLDSQTKKLVSQKFALLARVGVEKRKALGFQEEAEFYFTTAIEALVILEDVLVFLNRAAVRAPSLQPLVNEYESRQRDLIRQLLNYWPKDTESQSRLLNLLDSDGVASHLGYTPEGFVSLSSDQIIESLEQILERCSRE